MVKVFALPADICSIIDLNLTSYVLFFDRFVLMNNNNDSYYTLVLESLRSHGNIIFEYLTLTHSYVKVSLDEDSLRKEFLIYRIMST